ncbi:hypothetical protein AA13595_1715 [Gluconacetobacter johannae DSM 13595]|uniref:Glycosyltransferase family 2 protein n=1 Tax=Gluconacetobacter johannae TaxID=112140 RepID=A0A7W4J7H1_9PROT|nr:glycosyltransferase family 2 protein [Gluconacetobacter johannae]MBB2176116.1 glycosyltransferase family 2 protein [Gluconacetobacter johannae]GBQ85707.1 hypothetical protein AA13595_1715 [Gluconacetobacter johannae DSM 13595]
MTLAQPDSSSPLFSIVIPSYNRADDLQRCLHSALAQDWEDYEVIVSNNASPDHTRDVLDRFDDPRLRVFHQKENIGPEQNVAFVLQEARGKYIIMLTDDDLLMPYAITMIRMVLRQEPDTGLIFTPMRQIDGQRNLAGDHLWIDGIERRSDLPSIKVFPPGKQTFIDLFWHGHVLTRWVIRRDIVDLEGYKREIGRHLYSPMWITGTAMLAAKTVFLNQYITIHRILNKIYWEYPDDHMHGGLVAMLKELLADDPASIQTMLVMTAQRAINRVNFIQEREADTRSSADAVKRYIAALMDIPDFAAMNGFPEALGNQAMALECYDMATRLEMKAIIDAARGIG